MAYEHKEGQGSLFKNDKLNDRQPDYRGSIVIGGVTYEVAAWERTSQRGGKFLSLQASLPRERSEQGAQPQRPTYQAPVQPVMAPQAPMPSEEPFGFDQDEDLPF